MELRQPFSRTDGVPVWRDSDYICALAGDHRHLGHVVQADTLGVWHAYDATKLNAAGNGFKYAGQFDTLADAKAAVENSIAYQRPSVFRAGAAPTWSGFKN